MEEPDVSFTMAVSTEVHPLESVTVKMYAVDTVSQTLMTSVVSPLLQAYVNGGVPPDTDPVMLTQPSESGTVSATAEAIGESNTTSSTVSLVRHPVLVSLTCTQ